MSLCRAAVSFSVLCVVRDDAKYDTTRLQSQHASGKNLLVPDYAVGEMECKTRL